MSVDHLLVTVLVSLLIYVDALAASPKLTLQKPLYYINDMISISCDSGISTGLASVDVKISHTEVLCTISCAKADGKWSSIGQGFATDNCRTLLASGNVTLVVTTELSERMRSSTVTCIVKYIDGSSITSKSDAIANAFSDAYIAPTRLEFDKFEFDDNMPVLNKKIRAHCLSYGGYPSSELIYEMRNTSDSVVYSTTEVKNGAAEFTIDHLLKKGFKVTCRDKVHTAGEILLTRQNCSGTGSEVCMPWFVEIPSVVPRSQKHVLNPSYSNSVRCAVDGYPADKITYSWRSAGVLVTTGATYNLDANFSKDGTKENLTCTASLDKYGNEVKTWEITWSLNATTTAVPIFPAMSSTSAVIGVGVGIGLAVIVIAVVVGIMIYKDKKDSSRRYQDTASDPDSVTVEKKEKSAEKSSPQATHGCYPAFSKSDDLVIHASVGSTYRTTCQMQSYYVKNFIICKCSLIFIVR